MDLWPAALGLEPSLCTPGVPSFQICGALPSGTHSIFPLSSSQPVTFHPCACLNKTKTQKKNAYKSNERRADTGIKKELQLKRNAGLGVLRPDKQNRRADGEGGQSS